MPGGQPSQKAFESALAVELSRMDPTRPVLVEAESSKIGELLVPPSVWSAMKDASWIEVSAPMAARSAYLAEAYDDILSDSDALRHKLRHLVAFRGATVVENWFKLIEAYAKSMRAMSPRIIARFETQGLSDPDLDTLADRMAAHLQSMSMI
jgi:tRNA 2-selenouridine synthase